MTLSARQVSAPRGKPKAARPAEAKRLYGDQIALSEALDRKLLALQSEGQVGFVLPVGDWAGVLAVAAAAPAPNELIFPSLRESRVALFRGLPLVDVFRQSLGLGAPGSESQAGHALPGALVDAERRVAAPGGSPGAHLPHAVGAGLAARLQHKADAVLALASVAATDGDDCHVALNFAAVTRSPVVFLFRGDPGWAKGVVVERAAGYAIPALLVDGDDLAQVAERLETALATARQGKGPTVIEVVAPKLRSTGPLDSAALRAATKLCDAAFAEARMGVHPPVHSLVAGVFTEETWGLAEQGRALAGEVVVPPEEI